MQILTDFVLTLAWAILAFSLLRTLLSLWMVDKRVAKKTAVAVAVAFALGSFSPFVIRRGSPAAPVVTPPIAAPDITIKGSAVRSCRGARIEATAAQGHIDLIFDGVSRVESPSNSMPLVFSRQIQFNGWTANQNAAAASACIVVDGGAISTHGVYGLDRPDVAAVFNAPAMRHTGYALSATIPAGIHRISVAALTENGALEPISPALIVSVK